MFLSLQQQYHSNQFPAKLVKIIGKTEDLRVRNAGNVYIVGDGETDMSMGLCSARVAIAANMQANIAIELLVKGKTDDPGK